MEINHFDNALGGAVMEAGGIVEGRGVILTSNAAGDVCARLPANQTEAYLARFVAVWPQSNLQFPGPLAYPNIAFSLRRGGFDQAQTQPVNQDMWLTYPGMSDTAQTIPSGYDVILHGGDEGIYTVGSGSFVQSLLLVPGAMLEVLNLADDTTQAGKWAVTSVAANAVADVIKYDVVAAKLTFKTRGLQVVK